MSDSLDRTKRALDLIPYVLEHQGISMDDLAHRFNVSTSVLYEDLNLLFCCGLPGYTPLELIDMNFEDGSVSISNPQSLDTPRRLNKRELLRLHLGLELSLQIADSALSVRIKGLQAKISALLNEPNPVEIHSSSEKASLEIFMSASVNETLVEFEYSSASSDTLSERTVYPLSISQNLAHTYIEGFEIATDKVKNFRLDRISNTRKSATKFEYSKFQSNEGKSDEILLHVNPEAKSFLTENSNIILESHEVPGGFDIAIQGISRRWLISEIIAHGGNVSVKGPADLKLAVKKSALERLRSYQN
jgi:proteasome accessory factor C